jgi:uncharacterized protein involved in response to NO
MTVPGIPAGVVTENRELVAAPLWRREPYVVFFPLGILLSWAGVGRWLWFAMTARYEDYAAVYVFHSMTQVQGFLLSFALGFLFTMIPRRTGTSPPSALEMTIALAAPVFTAVAAWERWWMLSQAGWLAACALLVAFVMRRFLSGGGTRRPPTSFVWIPVALLLGLSGSLMTGAGSVLGPEWEGLHMIGQQFVLQGVFVALILGVGGLALPMMTRGEPPADATLSPRDLATVAAHVAAALLLVASFFVQRDSSLTAGCGIRAAVVAGELLLVAGLWRLPTLPGWNRRVIWLAAWCVPAGFAAAALFPQYYQGCLHVTFVGGFAMLTLAVSTHVVLGHGGRGDLVSGQPWQVGAIALLMVSATVARVAMAVEPMHRDAWMATAAFFFLSATVVWAAFLVPVILRRED